MYFINLLFYFLAALSTPAWAQSPSFCEAPKASCDLNQNAQQLSRIPAARIKDSVDNPDPLRRKEVALRTQAAYRLEYLQNRVRQLKAAEEIRLDEINSLLKQLNANPMTAEAKKKLENYQMGIKSLFEVVANLNSMQRAIPAVDAGRRPYVEDRIRDLQNVKIGLLLKFPLLAHPEFEKYITEKIDNPNPEVFMAQLSDKTFHRLLSGSLNDVGNSLQQQIREDNLFLRYKSGSESEPTPLELKQTSNLLANAAKNHSKVIDRLLEANSYGMEKLSPTEREEFCDLENALVTAKKNEARSESFSEAGLFALGLYGGAIGKSIGMIAGPGTAALLRWGLATASGVAVAGFGASNIGKIKAECQSRLAAFEQAPSSASLSSTEECYQGLGNSMIKLGVETAIATTIPATALLLKSATTFTHAVPVVTRTAALDGSIVRSAGAVRFESAEGAYTHFQLGNPNLVDRKKMEGLTNRFLDFSKKTYVDRDILTPAQAEASVATSRAFADRTQFLIHTEPITKGGKTVEEIKGGIGLVRSQNPSELLPVEKATGIRLDRSQGGIAEITKLVVSRDANKNVSGELIRQIEEIVAKDPTVHTVYIYTSKIHARLYKRGQPYLHYDRVLDDRDVLLRFNAEEVRILRRLGD